MPEVQKNVTRYVYGKSDAEYYRRLFAYPDTTLTADDDPVVGDSADAISEKLRRKLSKLQLMMGRLRQVKAIIETNGFQLLESACLGRVQVIEQIEIWDALNKGDDAEIRKLMAERNGLVLFFESFSNISQQISELQRQIEEAHNVLGDPPKPDDIAPELSQ